MLEMRSRVSNIRLTKCTKVGRAIGPAIMRDVVIEGLTTSDLLLVGGALFRHVILRGRVGSITINLSKQ